MKKKLLLLLLLFVFVNPIFSQIQQRGASTSASVNIDKKEDNPILTIPKPNGVQVGDIMLVTIAQQENKIDETNPASSGWTLVAGAAIEDKGGRAWGAVLYKIATPADASVNNYSFTLGSESKKVVGAIVAFSGVDTSNPLDAIGVLKRNDNDNNVTTNAITTVTPNTAVLIFGMSKKDLTFSNWQTITPGSLTEIFDNQGSGDASVGSAWAIKPTPGPTGEGAVQLNDKKDKAGAILLALRACITPLIPTNTRSDNVNWCTSTIRWDGSATSFFLDVATSDTFSAGTILSSYNNLNVGNVNSLVLSGLSPNTTYHFRVRASNSCGVSTNSNAHSFITRTIAAPTANSGYGSCNDWVAQWNGVYNTSGQEADGYFLDVAIDNTFTNYVTGYQNRPVGKTLSHTITGLAPGGVYYYRMRANTTCGTGGNSNVISFILTGNGSSTPGKIGGGAASICSGSNTTFTISGSNPSTGGQWSIFNQTGSATITQAGLVTGVSAGTVRVIFTTQNGVCRTSTSSNLTITAGATVSAASSTPTICANLALTPITHTTIGFSGISNGGVSGANGLPAGVSAVFASNTITISGTPTAAGTFNYSIPLTGGSCGSANATGTITVTQSSVAPTGISGTITICSGGSTTLTLTGGTAAGGTARWYSSSCGGTLVGSGNSIIVSPTSTTTYFVRYEGGCNTTTCASRTVTVNTTLAPTASSQTFCTGAIVSNLVAKGTTIKWYAASTGGTALVSTTSLASGTYFASQTLNSCESTRTSVTVTVNTTPAPTASSQTFCTGATVSNLVATGTTIKWYAASTGGTALVSTTSLASGTYFASQTLNSCESTRTSVTVTVNTTPAITAMTNATCSGVGFTSTPVNATNGVVPPGTTYTWTAPSVPGGLTGGVSGSGSSITGTLSNTTSSAQTAIYTVTPKTGSCTGATFTVTVTVNPLLTASVSIAANPSLIVCNGTSVTYTATPTNGGTSPAYQWKVNGTNVGTNSPTYTYTPVNGDQVSVVLTSSDACVSGLLTQPILNFSWNDNTKAITDSDYGIDALSGSGQYVVGPDGTYSLAPITSPKTDIDLTFAGTAPEFNSEGIDYSLSYLRNEGDSQLFTRGSSLIITGGSNFSVSYRVSNGAGSFTTVTSGNIFPIPMDNTFRNYRFRYDPSDGYGHLYVDGTEKWISLTATPGKPMYWTDAGDVVLGKITDASGKLSPTFDNLLMSAVYVKSAASQVNMTVNPVISNNTVSSAQTICMSTAPSAFTGTIPTGGSGSYVYLWESSTTSATSNFVTASGTSNTKGYTAGALTATTWYRRTVTSGGCSNTSTAIQITVNNTPTISGITSTATLCSGGSLNPTVPTVTDNGSTVTASGWQLETGVGSGSFASISIPYTVGFADNGKKIRYYATNGCGTINSNEVAITVEDVLAAPTIGAITQPDCVTPTGSVVLSGLPATWTLVRSDGTSSTTTSGTGTTTTISELAAGSYTYTVSNGTCTSSATTVGDIVINPAITNTWDGTKWSDGTPTILQAIKFTDGYDIDADVDGCSCKVTGSKNVTIKAGKTMKIVNEVEVLGSGKLIFENNASLVQINDDAVNKGNIIYKRTTPEIKKTDYVYWSSPVSLAALKAIQTGTLYYSFNGSGNSWVNANANTIMNTGKGYIVRGAGTWFDTGNVTLTANFVGTPTNGVIPVTIVGAGKNNLIGNPYPSAVDGDAFLAANTDVVPGGATDILEGTLYFWTHKSAIQLASGIDPGKAGSGAYAYTSDDYSAFTKVGGTNSVTGYIAAGQGFFARGSTTGGQAKFVNSMRLNGDKTLDNSGFLKPASASKTEKTTTTNKIEKSRIWLNLTNTQGAFKQMLLGYMTGATDNYDRGYDALSFNGNSFVNFYSINNTSLLTIQGRALPIQQTDVVPLGYSSTIAGDFSISIDKTDGELSTMAVFVEDKLTNTTHNLKKGAYTFTTEKGTFDDRFVLSYTNKTLATDDFQVVENQVVITSKNKEININASTNYIDKVFVYDVTGKQIFLKSKIDKNEFTISNLGSTNHVLVVKVLLQDNSIVTKKIIF
ncbi:Ig-like domain-containing protein [Flavobacterium degerlachei]|jgi:hypothetical protein|uniref:Fibronectin type III domain-containing protein n=1 Tax=Flavobacterium degerlachei TaxID=229203 RepID=A0A1H2Q7U8_9FLAO|nr:T9SS sorting signal type C domain-containing protein [Flavobacterium degerlachei]SDW02774.1 Fibronectin type III domain-containing protein [Flavobacterium degerlachei]